jgi:5-methylcytosine-specific restriction endonuclease McrA
MKTCTKCKIEKERSEFAKGSREKDGLQHSCKMCNAKYRAENKKQKSEYNAMYRERHRDALIKYCREWRKNNPEKMAISAANYRAKNADKILEIGRAYRLENRDKIIARCADYYAKNKDRYSKYRSENRHIASANERKRRARLAGADGSHTHEDIERIFKMQRGACVYCNAKLKKSGDGKMHVDHIQPLSKGGANWPHNLQLLCPRCNLTKRATDPFEFARRRGMLV